MTKKIFLAVSLPILLAACSLGGDDALAQRELERQLTLLSQRVEFLQKENARLVGDLRAAQESAGETPTATGAAPAEPDAPAEPEGLVCGGPQNFLCPEGYVCKPRGAEADALGVCEFALGESEADRPAADFKKSEPAEAEEPGEDLIILQSGAPMSEKTPEPAADSPTEPEEVLTAATPTEAPAAKPAPAAPAGDFSPPAGMATYESARTGITIAYPKFWYFAGTGTEDAAWAVGFGKSADFFDDVAGLADILLEGEVAADAAAPTRPVVKSWTDGGKKYRLSGPVGSAETLEKMASSLTLR